VADKTVANKNLSDLGNKSFNDSQGRSYAMQVSQEQYLKIKSLVDKTNIFFKDADTLNPQIQIKINNKTLEDGINAKRIKINQLLLTWDENNKRSLKTDQALVNEIKESLLYIQSYVEQLETIVLNLSPEDSGFSAEQINSYKNVITSSVSEMTQIIDTVNQVEITTRESGENNNNTNPNEITRQIEIFKQPENTIDTLENIRNNTATATTSKTSNPTETNVNSRPRIVDPVSTIIYQQNPASYKNTGVDVDRSGQMSPLQDW
jgi:hypothetical protein